MPTLASHFDIPVTLLDLAGVDYSPVHRPGRNLLALANGQQSREHLVAHYTGVYLCHERWKYHFYPNGGYEELFDLRNDPRELDNLAGRREHAVTRSDLKKRAEHWLRDYAAGHGLDEQGSLAQHAYEPPDEGARPNPYSRMPWESRVPPTVLESQGEKVGWWWRAHGMDVTAMLPGTPADIGNC